MLSIICEKELAGYVDSFFIYAKKEATIAAAEMEAKLNKAVIPHLTKSILIVFYRKPENAKSSQTLLY
ncbi:hypothetical protein [Ureibacillus sinduriensis]|uniref:Uncharacterized protein n=1 Tax=Ureibacillus sinduriensis BLB-1 = JCM 15800 TaxID=1384057 RepID=A0A0A3HWV1_9BACL|nr:hypothetical protein [Ureibacillus sinduriensis]KGR75695.1 hypothetical protein CD33_09290 [Ureibacillus sinduriensis BLB-1 = JCM 15800]